MVALTRNIARDLLGTGVSVNCVNPGPIDSPMHAPLTAEQRARTPDVTQPLIRTHPYLGRKAIYASPNHYVRIEGMPQEEGDALFQRLHDWIGRPEFVYSHRWRIGDVVMWDNTSVVHRRDAFPPTQRRFLKRTGFHLPEELAVPF